jgi:PAS domain S-box-containing protein
MAKKSEIKKAQGAKKESKTMVGKGELKESKEFALNIFSNLPIPASLSTPDGVRIDVNKADLKLLKRGKDERIGQKIETGYEKVDIAKVRKALENCKKIGYSSCQATAIRGNGTKLPIVVNFSALKDKEGNITSIIGTATDISELRKREEELEESRIYFQNFFNASPVPLTLIGLDGKRIDCNPAMETLTGRKREELVNVPVEATYLKEEQPLVRYKLVDETIEKGYMYGFETYFARADGTKLPIVVNTALLRDRRGKPSAIIYSATDISELRKRELNLKSAISNFGSVLSSAARGDLSTRVDLSKIGTEYKQIGKDINSTITAFNRMMKTIKGVSQDVSSKVERMAAASEETGSAMEEITESVKIVAKEATKQATAAMNQASATEGIEAALGEQTRASEEFALIGQELLRLSDNLLNTLKPFKIKAKKVKTA